MGNSEQLPAGYTTRAAAADDRRTAADIWHASDERLGAVPERPLEFLSWMWGLPSFEFARDSVVVERDATAVAFCFGHRDPATVSPLITVGRVHPDHLGRGLGTWLVQWIDGLEERHAAREHAYGVRAFISALDAAADRILDVHGFRHVRNGYDMEMDLPAAGVLTAPDPPDGVAIRGFERGRDERTFWEVMEASFSEHWGYVPSPYESHEAAWYRSEGWDPSRVFLAEVDGRAVGECAWVDGDGGGYVASVGVVAEHRHRGIGSALLRTAIADVASRKLPKVGLSVDAENETGAVALYEAAGLRVVREMRAYERGVSSRS